MRVVVIADPLSKKEFEAKTSMIDAIEYREGVKDAPDNADVVFLLLPENDIAQRIPAFSKGTIVFVNAVTSTLASYQNRFIRINAWPGFLGRDIVEVVAPPELIREAQLVLNALGWNFFLVPDSPGMVAPRIISMVINEAYFALGEQVSTRQEIDQAMQLGTNYPFGPFEWAQKIGLNNIYNLLTVLAVHDSAYMPAPALIKEVSTK